jgi:hypothetical protein
MTITFLAPDGVAVTAMQERQANAPMKGGGFGRPLGGRSGFRVDTPSTILTATSTTWTLLPCSAELDPAASTHQGMYGWASDQNITGAVTASDVTYARKDIVYIQVNDSSAGDGSGATSAPVLYLAGTPSATPTAPDLPPRSFLVGTITVPQTGGGSPTVVLNPARFVAAGGLLPVSSAADRPTSPYVGQQVCRLDRDGWIQTYNGTAWEYQRPSRRVYAVVNATNLVNETGSVSRVIYTMPATGLTKPYPQTVNVVARIALVCLPIASGSLQEWLAVSANESQVTDAQGRASVTFTVSSSSVLETLQAETGPLTVASGADPFARMWIQRPTASAVDTTVSSDPSFTQMYIDLRPQDD